MTFRSKLSPMWNNLQGVLFPKLENHIGPLSNRYKHLISLLELVRVEEFVQGGFYMGRRRTGRHAMARAFIAKQVLKLTYTKQIVEALNSDPQLKVICGWNKIDRIPSESKFSRAFREFALSNLPERVHEALISQMYQDQILGHISHDSTSIYGREKALKKQGSYKERKKFANNRYLREKQGQLSLRQKQLNSKNLSEMIVDLPTACDIGAKKTAQGYMTPWKGFKLHAAIDDHGIPITTILTSASLNDCEVAIPMLNKTSRLVTNFYDLMDAAYDVTEVKEYSYKLGHVPLVDKHSRSRGQKAEKEIAKKIGKKLNFQTAEERRYRERFSKERTFALLKEYFGASTVQYKGHLKVNCQIGFGVLAMTASMFLGLF